MRIFVTGAGGYIGSALAERLRGEHQVIAPTRREFDLLEFEPLDLSRFGADVVYLCAAKTRFIDCERDPNAYRVNVDAQIALARYFPKAIYLSSEAVESALHTAYGMQKALAEVGLTKFNATIARLGKVTDQNLSALTYWLSRLVDARPGVYRWGI